VNGDGQFDNPISLRVRYIFGVSYQWFRNGVQIDEFDAYDNDFTVRLPGDYHVQMTVNHNCRANSMVCPVLPILTPEPHISPVGPIVLCEDQATALSVAYTPGFAYTWQYREFGMEDWMYISWAEQDANGLISVNSPGEYRVIVGPSYSYSTCNGVSNTVEVYEPVSAQIAGLNADGTLCAGEWLTASAWIVGGQPVNDWSFQWYLNNEPIADASAQTATYRPLVTGNYHVVISSPFWAACPGYASAFVTIINDPFIVQPVTGGDYCHNGSDVWGNAIVKIGGPQLGVEYRVVNYDGDVLSNWVATPADVLDYPFVLEIPVPANGLDLGLNAYIVEARMIGTNCEPVELIARALLANYSPVIWPNEGVTCGTQVFATTDCDNLLMEDFHQWQVWNGAFWDNLPGIVEANFTP